MAKWADSALAVVMSMGVTVVMLVPAILVMMMVVIMTMTVIVVMAVIVVVVMIAMIMMVIVAMRMIMAFMTMTAAEQPYAGDIHRKTKTGDRNRFGEIDGNRREEPRDRFIGDEERDHGQNDRAGETGEVADLASPESEAAVLGVAARIAIGQGREQKSARMRAHMQPIRDERD